jgi:hypothetical protein
MGEKDIKRVNFFDGQFLKEAEFNGLSEYMVHMRRRMLFMLFDKSGVVQVGDKPLAIEPEGGGSKRIRIRAGTAVGMRPDAVEAKEIVLQSDIASIDLSSTLQAGNKGIVTIHYDEEPLSESLSAGDVPGITRIREKAVITVHVNQLTALNATNGEPFVRLGDVSFDSMDVDYKFRDNAFLRPTLLAQTPSISVDKTEVTAGQRDVILTVTSFGGFPPLSGVTANNVTIDPTVGQVTVSEAQINSVKLKINPPRDADPGKRTLTIKVNNISAQTSFLVQAALTITGFVPARTDDPLFRINGTAFQVPATVQFATASGSTAPVEFGLASFTQMTCPIVKIPADAISGRVKVNSAGRDATSDNPVAPPPEITGAEPGTETSGGTTHPVLLLKGKRFFPRGAGTTAGTTVVLVRNDGPTIQLGSPTPTADGLKVNAQSTGGNPATVLITTDGGQAKSAGTVSFA